MKAKRSVMIPESWSDLKRDTLEDVLVYVDDDRYVVFEQRFAPNHKVAFDQDEWNLICVVVGAALVDFDTMQAIAKMRATAKAMGFVGDDSTNAQGEEFRE